MEYVEYAGGVRTPSARSDGDETDPSSPDIGPSADPGILGTLKAILVGGVTDLLTDYPRPTPRSVSRARGITTAEKHSQHARAPNANHLRASDTFQRSGNGSGNNFTPFATDARLRASANDGFSSGIWAYPSRQSPPISPVRSSGRFVGRGRGGGDVAPANSLVGSPTAGGGPAGLLGAVFSGFSSLGQRATDLLTQLDHEIVTIFHGGDEEAARGEEGESPAAAAPGAPSADASQRAPPPTDPSPDDPRSTSSGTSSGCNGGPSSTGSCPGSSAPQEAVAFIAPDFPSPAGGALLKGLYVRAPTPAISSGASDKPQSATLTCSAGARVGTPKSDGGAAGAGTGRGGNAHTPLSSGAAGRGTIAKTSRGSGGAMATRANDGGAAAWARQSDDWGWGTSHDLADDGVGAAATSRTNITINTRGVANDKSSQVQQPLCSNVKSFSVQAPSSTAPSPLHSTRSGPVCSVSSATSGPSTSGSAAATQASGGSARSASRRSAGGKLIIIKSSAARIEGAGAAGAGGAAATAQPLPCTPTQAICATPADRVYDADTTSPTPTAAVAAGVSSVIAKPGDVLATAATWPVVLSTGEVMPLPALRCQSSPPLRQQEQPQQEEQSLPHQQQVQEPELLERKPQQGEPQGEPQAQHQDQLSEQLEQPQQEQQQQQLQCRDDNDVQSESERRLSELQQRFEAALADAARLAEALEATRTELEASRRRCEELEQEKVQLCKLLPPDVTTAWAPSASAPFLNTQRPKSPASAAATEPLSTTGYSHSTSSPCQPHLPSRYAHGHATVMLAKHGQLASRSQSRTHSRRSSAGSSIRAFGGGGVGNDELMEATLVAQLTAALADKARLWQENDILTRKLAGMQELLSYTLQHASCAHGSEGYDQRDCTVGRDDETVTGHASDIHHLRGEMGFDSAYCLDHTPCYYTSPPAPPPEYYSGMGAATLAEAQGGEDVHVPGATTSCTTIGQPFGCASGRGSCDGGVVTYNNRCFESDETRPGRYAWTPEVDVHVGAGRGAVANTLLPPTTDASVARSGADWFISPALLSPSLSGYSAMGTPATALDFNYAMDELTPGGYIGSRNRDGDDVSPATMISQIAATLAAHANDEFTRAGEDLHSQPHVLATSSPSCARITGECVKWEPLAEAGEVVVARRWLSGTEERAPHHGREAGNKAPPCAVPGGTVLGPYGTAAGEWSSPGRRRRATFLP